MHRWRCKTLNRDEAKGRGRTVTQVADSEWAGRAARTTVGRGRSTPDPEAPPKERKGGCNDSVVTTPGLYTDTMSAVGYLGSAPATEQQPQTEHAEQGGCGRFGNHVDFEARDTDIR